eukprot:3500906-Pyramimonas_sp.AAC.1
MVGQEGIVRPGASKPGRLDSVTTDRRACRTTNPRLATLASQAGYSFTLQRLASAIIRWGSSCWGEWLPAPHPMAQQS